MVLFIRCHALAEVSDYVSGETCREASGEQFKQPCEEAAGKGQAKTKTFMRSLKRTMIESAIQSDVCHTCDNFRAFDQSAAFTYGRICMLGL